MIKLSPLKKTSDAVYTFTRCKLEKYGLINSLSINAFNKWWRDYKLYCKLPKDLVEMVDSHCSTDEFKKISGHWRRLNKSHIELINDHGIENFKQTIEKFHYWGEEKIDSLILKKIVDAEVTINVETTEIFRKHEFSSRLESIYHNLGIIVLLNYIVNNGYVKYIDIMEESLFGNPIFIKYKNKRISFSLLTSFQEVDFISTHLNLNDELTFLEIGAGSGRTAFALMKTMPISKYFIVDIPPALFLSQESMIQNFPEKRIFKHKSLQKFLELKNDFDEYDIIFLTPDQLKFLPKKSVDVCLAIDCLHEMTTNDVESYFNIFNNIGHYFYFKCQIKQWSNTSKISYSFDNYPVNGNWEKIVHEKCFYPNDYFNALYKI